MHGSQGFLFKTTAFECVYEYPSHTSSDFPSRAHSSMFQNFSRQANNMNWSVIKAFHHMSLPKLTARLFSSCSIFQYESLLRTLEIEQHKT